MEKWKPTVQKLKTKTKEWSEKSKPLFDKTKEKLREGYEKSKTLLSEGKENAIFWYEKARPQLKKIKKKVILWYKEASVGKKIGIGILFILFLFFGWSLCQNSGEEKSSVTPRKNSKKEKPVESSQTTLSSVSSDLEKKRQETFQLKLKNLEMQTERIQKAVEKIQKKFKSSSQNIQQEMNTLKKEVERLDNLLSILGIAKIQSKVKIVIPLGSKLDMKKIFGEYFSRFQLYAPEATITEHGRYIAGTAKGSLKLSVIIAGFLCPHAVGFKVQHYLHILIPLEIMDYPKMLENAKQDFIRCWKSSFGEKKVSASDTEKIYFHWLSTQGMGKLNCSYENFVALVKQLTKEYPFLQISPPDLKACFDRALKEWCNEMMNQWRAEYSKSHS